MGHLPIPANSSYFAGEMSNKSYETKNKRGGIPSGTETWPAGKSQWSFPAISLYKTPMNSHEAGVQTPLQLINYRYVILFILFILYIYIYICVCVIYWLCIFIYLWMNYISYHIKSYIYIYIYEWYYMCVSIYHKSDITRYHPSPQNQTVPGCSKLFIFSWLSLKVSSLGWGFPWSWGIQKWQDDLVGGFKP